MSEKYIKRTKKGGGERKMYYIAKKTKKIRYKTMALILKKLTPDFYKKIDFNYFINKKDLVFLLKKDNIPNVIRPTIKFIKESFNKRLITGVEIGVQRGRNSENILKNLNVKKLYLIDPWISCDSPYLIQQEANYNTVLRRFKNIKEVRIIKAFSEIAVKDIKDNSLDFIYIDGAHDYDNVYKDIKLWFPKVKRSGVIGGHDICIPDVLKAVKEFCSNKKIKFQTEIPDWYFVKE